MTDQYVTAAQILNKKGYEKQDMTKHKLRPSKEMSAVQKNPNKSNQQNTIIKENSKN